jgi:hypothetical protein
MPGNIPNFLVSSNSPQSSGCASHCPPPLKILSLAYEKLREREILSFLRLMFVGPGGRFGLGRYVDRHTVKHHVARSTKILCTAKRDSRGHRTRSLEKHGLYYVSIACFHLQGNWPNLGIRTQESGLISQLFWADGTWEAWPILCSDCLLPSSGKLTKPGHKDPGIRTNQPVALGRLNHVFRETKWGTETQRTLGSATVQQDALSLQITVRSF